VREACWVSPWQEVRKNLDKDLSREISSGQSLHRMLPACCSELLADFAVHGPMLLLMLRRTYLTTCKRTCNWG
jgi:hypothetical protein